MAFDLILGITKKNWSRGAMPSQLALPPAEPAIECTAREKAGLEKMASIKMRAEAGDRQAKIQWIAVAKKFRATKARAVAGDPKAKRSLAILKQSGFLQDAQRFSFSSGEQASFDDAWGQAKKYGSAVEKKDAKAARDSIEWMILRGWKASGSAGSFPFYTKITWANASLPGKKIAFSTAGSAYAVAVISGETLPRKAWSDSEPVPQGARKAWADEARPSAALLPRKSWIDDEIPTLARRAKAGDISAQIALRKIALRKSADEEEMSLGGSWFHNPFKSIYHGLKKAEHGVARGLRATGRGLEHGLSAIPAALAPPGGSLMNGDMEDGSLMGDAIPHDTYRAAVMLTAIKDANGSRPTTKDIFAAKAKVDNKLGNMGVSIYLPGARPARRTY